MKQTIWDDKYESQKISPDRIAGFNGCGGIHTKNTDH
jgi:hypothetical protein